MKPCPRCGADIKGKYSLCQPCATTMANKKRFSKGKNPWVTCRKTTKWDTHPYNKSITLPKVKF